MPPHARPLPRPPPRLLDARICRDHADQHCLHCARSGVRLGQPPAGAALGRVAQLRPRAPHGTALGCGGSRRGAATPPPHRGSSTRAFAAITLINLAYTALEAGYVVATDSLALLSDALHNFGDVLGLGLAWGAAVLAKRRPTERHTYGWRRATLLSPLANSTLLIGFSGALTWEAVRRLGAPPQIPAMPVIVVAAIGIVVNLGAAWFVRDGHANDLNRLRAFQIERAHV